MIGRADDPLNPFNAPPPISHDFIAASIRRTKDHLSRIRHRVIYLSFCLTYVLLSIIKKRIRIVVSALILAYTHTRLCVYICKYPFVCVYMQVSALIFAYTHTHTQNYQRMHVCVCGERKRGHKAQPGSYFSIHMHREARITELDIRIRRQERKHVEASYRIPTTNNH
jgi:hypothetical protein